ncbi:MAG: hypothetical protein AAF928_01230 [Myxococcota bacterium]
MDEPEMPVSVRRLFWEFDAGDIDPEQHADYVIERVMTRGTWAAMRWLRNQYSRARLADFIRRRGDRLAPRDLAYWGLIAGVEVAPKPGGGRPRWAG